MSATATLRDRLASTAVNRAPINSSFVPTEVLQNLGTLSRQDADSCNFGIVRVDDAGKITLYNKYEGEMGGNNAAICEGKNFFTQVAPCNNNSLSFGTFKKGLASGSLNAQFNYTFTYKMKPTNVKIHMYRDDASQTNWIFVMKV